MRLRLRTFLDERFGSWIRRCWLFGLSLPGGPRWSYVWGTALGFLLAMELFTGLALMTVYVPSAQGAWASVFYIQHHFRWGSLVRGMHYWGAQVFLVLVVLHLLQVGISGAYKRPREGNWWVGLVLLGLAFGFAHSGALLPWDQRAFWTTRVEAGIAASVPVVGGVLQRWLQGGRDLGTLTLTRLYMVHVGLLPLVTLSVLAVHLALVRRHGLCSAVSVRDEMFLFGGAEGEWRDARRARSYWPDQAVRDAVVSLAVIGLVIWLSRRYGVPLDAPADPDSSYPARPEWFLLWLYKLRKMFEGRGEVVATVVIPSVVALYLIVLPWLDRGASRLLRDRIPWVATLLLVVAVAVGLTVSALRADARDPAYRRARAQADQKSRRAQQLAAQGIPPEGPLEMMRNDPRVRPAELFEQHCAGCHAPPGVPVRDEHGRPTDARGPTLDGFGSREWIRSFLNDPDADDFFGRTEIHDMPSQARRLGEEGMAAVVEYLYAQSLEPGDSPADPELVRRGDEIYHRRCTRCHQGPGDLSETPPEERDAPDLTGWGSRAWIRSQLLHPSAPERYGARNAMPSFAEELQGRELEWVIDYVRQLRRRPAPVVVAPSSDRRKTTSEGGAGTN